MPPAYPAFSLLFCPHPPARARRALFPAGRGDYKLILPGASPPAPRQQTVYGTAGAPPFFLKSPLASPPPPPRPAGGLPPPRPGIRPFMALTAPAAVVPRRGGLRLGRRLACHRYTRRGGANKAGTLKIHRAADRRQAAGRSSRAEYSEAPGIGGPLSGSDGSFFVILPDRRSSFCGEKRPPG